MPKVTVKRQVTIPRKIRESLGLEPGNQVRFEIQGDKCILEKEIEVDPLAKWVGFLKGQRTSDEIVEELRGEKD